MDSVTHMLDPHSSREFDGVSDSVLVPAQIRGTLVHRFCAASARRVWVAPLPDLYKGYGRSFEKILPEIAAVLFSEDLIECPITCCGFNGHPDLVVRMRTSGLNRLIDVKTGVKAEWWKLQLSAYWHLVEHHLGIPIDEAGDLVLDADGDWPKWIAHEKFKLDYSVWHGYVNFYRYLYGY